MESSAGPNAPSESSPELPSQGNLSVVEEAQVNQGQGSQKPGTVLPWTGDQTIKKPTSTDSAKTEQQVSKSKRTLKSLRDFPLPEIFHKWYRDDSSSVFRKALTDFGIKNNIDGFVKILYAAAELIRNLDLGESHFNYNLTRYYKKHCNDNPNGPKLTLGNLMITYMDGL